MKKKLLGYYDYTVILTYLGAVGALVGVFLAVKGAYLAALTCLMFAGLCDMFDGLVASTKKRDRSAKRFGIQIDSLSDLISFGVLPGLFVYFLSGQKAAVGIVSVTYILCALIRLAYFNVLEEERQDATSEARHEYLGLPVTSIAVLLPALYLIYDFKLFAGKIPFAVLIALVAVGFILPFRMKKPHFVGKIILIVLGCAEFVGIVVRFVLTFVK